MRVLVPIADGVEEIEAVTIIDVLRRAGIDVDVASIHERLEVTASRGCLLKADHLLTDCPADYDLIALAGGLGGAENLAGCTPLIERLRRQRAAGRRYAAICAAPALVLAPHGLLDDLHATAYPSFQDHLPRPCTDTVVEDGQCITSQGPGTAMRFALALVECLTDRTRRDQVAAALLA